jgi:hypothetical protein
MVMAAAAPAEEVEEKNWIWFNVRWSTSR